MNKTPILTRHSREGGSPVFLWTPLDSRLRGNDERRVLNDERRVLNDERRVLNDEVPPTPTRHSGERRSLVLDSGFRRNDGKRVVS